MTDPGQLGTIPSTQNLQNSSFVPDFGVFAVMILGYDGVNASFQSADAMAMKMTVDGAVTYIAVAAPGTAEATEKWQVRKLDESSGLVITWADGDSNFNNAASDLTALSYS